MMSKVIYNKYDKAQIATLPVAEFQGRTNVVLTAGEAERAVDFLLGQPLLGFDTETRPSFKRGQNHKTALLQVSAEDICFLFRLNYTGLTPALRRLLEDREVTKIGLSWHDDLNSLHKLGPFETGTFIDVQTLVREISKRQQLSNWEADVLSDKQKLYAATDAWACIEIYKETIRLKETGDYKLIVKEEPHE